MPDGSAAIRTQEILDDLGRQAIEGVDLDRPMADASRAVAEVSDTECRTAVDLPDADAEGDR